jgi:AraC-like DNA-binding protein
MVRWDVERAPMSVQLLTRLGADYGVPARACLECTGLTEEDLRDPSATVTAKQELTLIANLVRTLGDTPGIGLDAGTRYHLTTYGIWGFALISSPTWRSAIDVGLRYIDLTFAFCRIQAREQGQEMQLVLDTPEIPIALKRFVVERDSAAIQTIQQEVFASPIPIKQVSFVFPPPADGAQRYTEIFGVAPVFGAQENAVSIDPSVLDLPLPQSNEHTTAIAQAQCRELLARRHARTGLAGRVRDQLVARAADPPGLDQVAAKLNVSDRTLRRRLAGEGVSFRGLLDEVREQLAEELLVTGGLSVAEVAERLGYLEVSSFSQAFRRWKGVGPRAYRARQPERIR